MFLGVVLSNVAGKVIICDKNVSASGGGRFQKLSSISSKNCRAYRAYRAGTWKLSSISSRDLKTVEVSNYRAGTWKLSQYRSLEHCPMWRGKSSYAIKKNVSASGGGRGQKTVEHIEHIEQGLENCRAYRAYQAGTWKLSRYRTIEQGLENCRNIGHSSIVQCGGESHHMR